MTKKTARRLEAGFTLVELLVVVLIIGILASIAIPQYFKVVERARASEAVSIIGEIARSQARYHMRYASYAGNVSALDIGLPGTLKNFNPVGAMAGAAANWNMSMQRNGAPASYGSYAISFTASTNGGSTWSCGAGNTCSDLVP